MSSESSANRMTQRSVALFAGLLAVLTAVAMVAGVYSFFVENESDEVSWLYSQTSDTAELDDLGGGKHRLIMRNVDRHTIQFSDRPDRLVEVIETANFVHGWDTMFATSPPNAVLIEHEPNGATDSLVVVLTNPQFDLEEATIQYDAEILEDEQHPERLTKLANAHAEPPANMRAVSLFIDSVTATGQTANAGQGVQPIFTGPAADALRQKLGLPSMPTSSVSLGGGVKLNSASVSYNSTGGLVATATIGFSDSSFTLDMNLSATDAKNWSLTVASAQTSSATWSPPAYPGLSFNPSTFSGSISSTDGAVAYSLTGAQHTWSFEDGASIVSTPTFSSACPLGSKCDSSVTGPFLSMNGTLFINKVTSNQGIPVTGAMTTNASWIRFDANLGSVTFGPFSMSKTTVTIWEGNRGDTFNKEMVLPSMQASTGGVDVEMCANFTADVPKIGNKATSGCARWSNEGVIVGQIGIDSSFDAKLSSTATTSTVSSTAKGLAWTNLTDFSNLSTKAFSMSGVSADLQAGKIVLAGKTTLPGVITKALGLSSGDATQVVDVTGAIGKDSFSLEGNVTTNIKIGKEPFKINVVNMKLSLSVTSDQSSFSIGTKGMATVGYGDRTRDLSTSVQLVVLAGANTEIALSVTARGTAAPGETQDGLSAATALTMPSQAQYVWPDQFGIKGLNLWNLTVQISYAKGSAALGYTSTSYMDPKGGQTKNIINCADPKNCTDADWLVGQLGFNISYTTPCFAYSFDSSNEKSGFVIDGGVMKATTFKVGIAPTGCQIQSGDQQLSLPAAFAGFQFDAAFGSTTVSVATQVSEDGFYFNTTINSLKFAGISYSTVQFTTKITASESSVYFKAVMTSGMGDMDVTSNFSASGGNITQSLDASLKNWGWKKAKTVDLKVFNFSQSSTFPADTKCASFTVAASGQLTLGSKDIVLQDSGFSFDCNGVKTLNLNVTYTHTAKWSGAKFDSYLQLSYPYNDQKVLYGDAGFSYNRTVSKKIEGVRFRRDVTVSFDMQLTVDATTPSNSAFSFKGNFDADRVSGAIGCSIDGDGADFTCGGTLRLNPKNAGVARVDWGDL